jgi:predicted nucleic acid-binding protein
VSVIDASVALRWFLNESGAEEAKSCFAPQDALAPDLALAEIANGLWVAVRRGRINRATADTFLQLSQRVYVGLTPSAALQQRAFEIACALDAAPYDCFYLALAERMGRTFVTVDRRLLSRTIGTSWQRLINVLTP